MCHLFAADRYAVYKWLGRKFTAVPYAVYKWWNTHSLIFGGVYFFCRGVSMNEPDVLLIEKTLLQRGD